MSTNWKSWCRFCGKSDTRNEGVVPEVESIEDSLDIVNKHFSISLQPGSSSSICNDCTKFLKKLEEFKDTCLNTDKMFKELSKSRRITSSSLQTIREKYGIDDTEDPLEMETEDSISAKLEKYDRISKDQNRGKKRKAENKKLFVVSLNDEKTYLAVTYEGPYVEYTDFIQAVCSHFCLPDMTLFCPNDIRISPEAFDCVFESNPPAYVVLKPGSTSRTHDQPSQSRSNRNISIPCAESIPERIDVLDYQELEKSCQDLIYKQSPVPSNGVRCHPEVSSGESSHQDPQDNYQDNLLPDNDTNPNEILHEIMDVKRKLEAGFSDMKTSLQLIGNHIGSLELPPNQVREKKTLMEQPHFFPLNSEEAFLAFNNESQDGETFKLAVSYFTWILKANLHESVRIMIHKGIDDKFSRSVTFFGENNTIKFDESGLARAIYQALSFGQFDMPNAKEFRDSAQAALNAAKQRDRNRQRAAQINNMRKDSGRTNSAKSEQ